MRGPLITALLILCAGLGAQSSCVQLGSFRSTGTLPTTLLPSGTLHEVSGLEMSRINPEVLWAHDDAGNGNFLVALRSDGRLVQQYRIGSLPNFDWEDIAIGPGPEPGRDYIYLADIGNNKLSSSSFSLVRFLEPQTPATPGAVQTIRSYEVFRFSYPQQPRDAETLLIDPVDGRPYILTKEPASTGTGRLFGYPMPLDAKNSKVLQAVVTFRHAAPKFSGGDVSADGWWILVRNGSTIYAFERGAPQRSFAAAFLGKPCVFLATGQGNAESLALAPDGRRLYGTAEAAGAAIYSALIQLPRQSPALASYWAYGSGLASGLYGTPGLGLDTVPRLGGSLGMRLYRLRPSSRLAVAFGSTPVPDGVLGFAGGWLHIQPGLLLLARTDAAGEARLGLGTLPTQVSLVGAQLHAQAACEDSTAPQGLALSRGLSLQLGY